MLALLLKRMLPTGFAAEAGADCKPTKAVVSSNPAMESAENLLNIDFVFIRAHVMCREYSPPDYVCEIVTL
jgi:hypothetical protein